MEGGTVPIDCDLSAPFINYGDGTKPDDQRPAAVIDEDELIKYAKSQLKGKSQLKLEDKQEVVDGLLSGGDFSHRLAHIMKTIDHQFPCVEIRYKDLNIETDALVGTVSNPTVGNSFKKLFLKLTCQGGLKTQPMSILQDVNGIIKPGRLTLLLGPPGGGKSILLQTLSGRKSDSKSLRIKGEVTYNGSTSDEFELRRTAGLVNQLDNHIPELTVLETVQFAADCQNSKEEALEMLAGIKKKEMMSAESVAAATIEEGTGELSAEDKELLDMMKTSITQKLQSYVTLRVLGLDTVADTIVGSATVRGVSGGQRKRVTTAELLAGPQWVLLMDEISTGLDSATTYSVVQSLKNVCEALQRTVLVSLLQPQPEVFSSFTDLVLITDGRVIYHGPVDQAMPFYREMGFDCPPRKDPASFLQEITTPLGQLSYATDAILASHGIPLESRDPSVLLNNPPKELIVPLTEMSDGFWKKSSMGQAILDELKASSDSLKSPEGDSALAKTKFANPGYHLAGLVFKRSALLMRRMRAYYTIRMVQTIILSLIIASLYARVDVGLEEGRNVMSFAATSATYLSLINTPQIGLVYSIKSVLLKHRDNNYFPMWTYVTSNAVNQLLPSTIESTTYAVITYWVAGLTPNAGLFFLYLAILWSTTNCLAAIFQLVAFISPSIIVANAFGSLLTLLMLITNGFSILRTSIPPYLIWFYWINPISWSIRALCINELSSSRWGEQGQAVMNSFAIHSDEAYVWGAILYLWALLIIIGVAGAFALKNAQAPQPQATLPAEESKKEANRSLMDALKRRTLLVKRSAVVPVSDEDDDGINVSKDPSMVVGNTDDAMPAVAFTPITLVCRNIDYFVTDPSSGRAPGVVDKSSADKEVAGMLQLLHGINFYAAPGQLSALMGGSGAGKTTLMDVVAGRKTQGVVRGEILVNGRPKEQDSWARVVGYVEQQDIHSATITVRESLIFSARLRLDEATVGWDQVMAIVEDTLDVVELRKVQHSIVGDGAGGPGLSLEQRKRLSIAVELVANPSVMFMDEPTSGLDARAAAIVMRAVRKVADTGRCILVTIHQPSIELFEVFDQLVLMQKGGRLTYFGPLGAESCDLIAYLQDKGCEPIQDGANPSTWMLEVTGGSTAISLATKVADVDFPTVYAQSQLYKDNEATMDELVQKSLATTQLLAVTGTYATSITTQSFMLAKKFIYMYWRSPNYNYTRIMIAICVALIYGLVFLDEGDLPNPCTIEHIQNVMGVLFSMSFFLGMFNAMTTMPVVAVERAVFNRERSARMYGPFPYSTATCIAEIPYLVVQAIVLVTITYFMIGFQLIAWKYFYFLLMIFGSIMLYTFFGQALVVSTPNLLIAQLAMAALSQLFTYFNGFLVPYPQIPQGWKWLNRLSPTTWVIYGLAASQLGDRDDVAFIFSPEAPPPEPDSPPKGTVPEFMSYFFDYDFDFIWYCMLIVYCYALFFRIMIAVMLTFFNFQKR